MNRESLLERILPHVAANGLMDASLREIAEAVGTSHRMLIYHFGSRDGLVAAVVAAMEAAQRQTLLRLASEATDPADLVRRQWTELTRPEVLPFVRLFFDVLSQAAAGKPGTDGFLESLTEPWLDMATGIADRMGAEVARPELRVGVAVMRGLLVDVLAGCPIDEATAALEAHLARWTR